MSTFAAARVETKISITGENNAKAAVSEARDGLKGMAESSGDLEKGLLGVRDLVGNLPGPVQKIADVFGGAEKILQVMPGPIGMIGAGLTVAAAAGYLLYKHVSETAAKVESLGDAGTRGLADRLGLDVDQAIKLQQALEDVPGVLRPSEALLGAVQARAEAMGKEGAEAAQKFVDALARGPEALKDFEREFGRLAQSSTDLPTLADRLGLSREALGVATQVGNEAERAKKAAEQAVVLERQREALTQVLADLDKQIASAAVVRSLELQRQRDSVQRQVDSTEQLVASTREEANALQAVVDKQREAERAAKARQQVASVLSAEIAVFEAQAGAQLDKQEALRLRLHASQQRQYELGRKQAELEAAYRKGLVAELDYRQQIAALKTEGYQLAAQDVALGKQATADLDARRQKAQAARDAEVAARIRLSRAEADAAGQSLLTVGQVHELRLRTLAQEEQAELAKARRDANTEKGRQAAIQAVRLEFAEKRRQLDAQEVEAQKKTEDELLATLTQQAQRSADIATKTAEVVAQGAGKRASALADRLREAGQFEQADLVERRQAWADYQADVQRVNVELQAQLDQSAEGSQDRANLESQQLELQAQAYEAYQARLNQADQDRNRRLRESVAEIAQAIQAPAALITSSGGPGAKLGRAMQALAQGVQQVSANWKGMRQSAPDAISAVGGVAAAFVDGERQKAAILAVTEAAAAVASYPNIQAMVAHGAAAVLYGSVAAGAFGGGAGAPSVPSVGGAGTGGDAALGGAGSGQGGQVVNVYFGKGFVVGTEQTVGMAVQGALGSLKGTGLRAKGV